MINSCKTCFADVLDGGTHCLECLRARSSARSERCSSCGKPTYAGEDFGGPCVHETDLACALAQRDEARAEVARLSSGEAEWAARRCECGADDACAFARERDEAVEALESLETAILELLPYRYHDGTDDEADPGECVGYAAEELADLRKKVVAASALVDRIPIGEAEWAARRCECGADDACAFARERDAAKADTALAKSLHDVAVRQRDAANWLVEQLTKERDEARAEVERLQAKLLDVGKGMKQ